MRRTLGPLLLPVYLPILLVAIAWGALAPALPEYLLTLGAPVALVGFAVGLRGLGQLVSDVPGGLLLERFGLRRMTVTAFLLSMLANGALVLVREVWAIVVLLFASGLFTSIVITAAMTAVRATVPPMWRGRALAAVGGSLRIGMLVGPIAGGLLADYVGVPSVFALRTAVSLAAAIAVGAGMPRLAVSAGATTAVADGTTLMRVWRGLAGRRSAVATVGFAILVLSILRAARELILPLWGASLGQSTSTIGLVMGVAASFDLLLFVPAGMVSDRYGRKVAAALCLGLFSLGLALLVPSTGAVGFVVAAAIVGLGNGFGAGINMTTGADLAPDGAVAPFLGLWRLYGDIGSAAGPPLVGALAAALALGPAVAITAAIGFVGMLVMVGPAPETRDIGAGKNAAGPS